MNANIQTGPLARILSLRRNVARRAKGHQQDSGRRPASFRGGAVTHTPAMFNAVSPLDTVRIECLGEGRAVTMPAAAWLETRDRYKALVGEVTASLAQLDELARVWGDEGMFHRIRDRLRAALAEATKE
jgi:hypothetical protein